MDLMCVSLDDHVNKINNILGQNKIAVIRQLENNKFQISKLPYDKKHKKKSKYTHFDSFFCFGLVSKFTNLEAFIFPKKANYIEIYAENNKMSKKEFNILREKFRLEYNKNTLLKDIINNYDSEIVENKNETIDQLNNLIKAYNLV